MKNVGSFIVRVSLISFTVRREKLAIPAQTEYSEVSDDSLCLGGCYTCVNVNALSVIACEAIIKSFVA